MKDSENSSDAGSDENGRRQISRGEGEWRDILRRADRETARFLGFYEETFRAEQDAAGDRLDRCALAMGWHLGSPEDGEDDSGAATRGNAADFSPEQLPGDSLPLPAVPAPDFSAVYSLHNLPECIAVGALFRFARSRWCALWESPHGAKLSAGTAAALSETLSSAQRDMMLAVDAEDALEFGLAVCLMKNAHAALNGHFALMEKLSVPKQDQACARASRELRCALMDLRDVCLRVLLDARRELEKNARDGEA